MSHITTRIDEKRDLAIHTVEGAVTTGEIRSVLEEYYQQHVTAYVVWDLTNANADLQAVTGEAYEEPFAIQAFRSMDEAMQWLLPST
jgi:hypothetical protein